MTQKTLYLHVGTQKTGSSAIQQALRLNRELLAEKSVHYIEAGRAFANIERPNHNWLAKLIKDNGSSEVFAMIEKEFNERDARSFVVSGEMLFSPLVAERLPIYLSKSLIERTKIVVYLRRPDLFLESLYKQRLKRAETRLPPREFYERGPSAARYFSILSKLSDVFGYENIEVRLFDRNQLVNRDATDDFFHFLGVSELAKIDKGAREWNPSFSRAFTELFGYSVRNLNVSAPRLMKSVISLAPDGIMRSRDVYDLPMRRKILEDYEDDLEVIRKRFYSHSDILFDAQDLCETAMDPYPDLNEELELQRSAAKAMLLAVSRTKLANKSPTRT